jgi:hypothetical protein
VSDAGLAYIFHWNGSNWIEQAIISPNLTLLGPDDRFGLSVGISGDYAIIGANKGYRIGAHEQGLAYIFKRNISDWNQQDVINASDGEAYDNFGTSVGISGDYAIVGHRGDSVDDNSGQGSTYIFSRSDTTWIQKTKITSSDGNLYDRFGTSVSISGNYAIIGASGDDIGENEDQGSAYIVKKN